MSHQGASEHMAPRFADVDTKPADTSDLIPDLAEEPLVSLDKAIEPLSTIVPNVQQKISNIRSTCGSSPNDLSNDEVAAIKIYTMEWTNKDDSLYFKLNDTLRSVDKQKLKPWLLYLRLFQHALSKIQSDTDQTVYRGIKIDVSKEYPVGKIFPWPAFSSSSTAINVIKDFLGETGPRTLFVIKCNTGKDIHQYSEIAGEYEILLLANTFFKVVGNIEQGNEFHIIQLEEIQPLNAVSLMFNPELRHRVDTCSFRSKVDLENLKLTDTAIRWIVENVIVQKQCAELCLKNNMITSKGVSTMAVTLENNTTLKSLWLDSNQVSDIGVASLTAALSKNRSGLQSLGLSSNQITDEGAKRLAEMLKTNTTLISLKLSGNAISDQGVKCLADVFINVNSTLESIDLSGNRMISDQSIRDLMQMIKRNKSLSSLYLFDCGLSEDGKQILKSLETIRFGFNLRF